MNIAFTEVIPEKRRHFLKKVILLRNTEQQISFHRKSFQEFAEFCMKILNQEYFASKPTMLNVIIFVVFHKDSAFKFAGIVLVSPTNCYSKH